jgi:hypothetical protein
MASCNLSPRQHVMSSCQTPGWPHPRCHHYRGASLDNEALDQAVEMQVQGIIVGGISPAMIPRLLTVDFL